MRNYVTFLVFSTFIMLNTSTSMSNEIDDKSMCSSGSVRLLGNVYLQDKNSRVSMSSDGGDMSFNNNDITLTIQENSDFLWFREIIITPDDQGLYLFLGKCSDERNKELTVTASIDGKTIDGKYVMTDPLNIEINTSKIRKNVLLRSLENASSAVFDKCNSELNASGGISQVSKNLDNFKAIQDCYNRAESFFEKLEIHGPKGDLYEVFGNFEKCYQIFDKLSYLLKEKQDTNRYEKAKLRSAICREKNIINSRNYEDWDDLSNFAREAMQEKISSKDIRVQMIRIWFDSFLRKINADGNMSIVASRIESDSHAREEWVDLYYKKYFWGESDNVPQFYKKEIALKDLKRLSDQFNRNYGSIDDGKPKTVKPRGR